MSEQIKIIEDYCGYTITYSEGKSVFIGVEKEEGGNTFRSEKLSVLKERIFEGKKNLKSKQKKQACLLFEKTSYDSLNHKLTECTAGTFGLVNSRYRASADLFCWMTVRGNRTRVEINRFNTYVYFKDTPVNRKLMNEISEIEKEAKIQAGKAKDKVDTRMKKLSKIEPTLERDNLPQWEQ